MKTTIIILSAIGIALPWHTPKTTSSTRDHIIHIASAELGVREATGNNDGKRVEEYLRYTDLGKGHQWCAAFVSWSYGQAGLAQPRNPWSPALFPNARTYWKNGGVLADQQPLPRAFRSDGQAGKHVQVKKKKNEHAMLSARPKTSNSSATAQLDAQLVKDRIGHQIFWMHISKSIQKIYRPCLFQRAWGSAGSLLGIGQRPWSLGLIQGLGPSAVSRFQFGGQEDGKAVHMAKPPTTARHHPEDERTVRATKPPIQINPADIFGIYGRTAKRINHVGLVKQTQGQYLITIEGNSNNKVESRRRHLSTVYALADWVF